MTKVDASELGNLRGDKVLSNLEELSAIFKKGSRVFDNFATYSGRRLKGEGYDAIRVVASFAASALSKFSELDLNAHDNIVSGADTFIAFMDGYSTLDDSNVNHLGDGLRYIGTQIGMLQVKIQKEKLEGDDLTKANNQLSYWQSKYDEILKEYEKLKELPGIDSSTGACIDSISSDTKSVKSILTDNWR